MTARIFFKLIATVLCVLVVALAAVDYLASRVAEKTHLAVLVRDLSDKCRILAVVGGDLSQSTVHEIAKAAGGRVTLIAHDGSVLADSEARPDLMENHRDRPEVQAAFAGRERTLAAYRHAVQQRYRFFSYGDAMFVTPQGVK